MTTDDKKIIYSMMRVGKVVPPNKQILRDISLSYFTSLWPVFQTEPHKFNQFLGNL